jgi:hypothetical protein
LREPGETPDKIPNLKKMKPRIEAIADYEDLKMIAAMLEDLQSSD